MKDKNKKDISHPIDSTFEDSDLNGAVGSLSAAGRNRQFLGRFSTGALLKIMDGVGLSSYLGKKGFNDLYLKLDIDDSLVNYFRLYYKKEHPDNLMIDLRMSEVRFLPEAWGKSRGASVYDMIVTEWLSAQDPLRKEFDEKKPMLPGQTRPGLGVLNYCFEMMYILAREVFKDGFMDVPDHMHGAIMYSKKFMFYNPVQEAVLKAILRDLNSYSIGDISWGMTTGTIIEINSGEPQVFSPSEQIFPVSERMKKYFQSREYRDRLNSVLKRKKYRFEYRQMLEKKDEFLKGSRDALD